MKKYLNFLMMFILIGSSAGMEIEKEAMAEQPVSVLTSDEDEIEIPASLADQSKTIRHLIKDLQNIRRLQDLPEEERRTVPLPSVTTSALNFLITFHKGKDFSAASLDILFELLEPAFYLDYKGQDAIADLVIDALSKKGNRTKFLTGNLNLDIPGADLLKEQLIQRMEPCLMRDALIIAAQEPKTLEGHTDWISSVAISLDGRSVVTDSRDKTTKTWDITNGEELDTLKGHTAPEISSVAISGKYRVTGSDDITAKIRDRLRGKELHTLKGHTAGIPSVAIFPNGRYVLTGSLDKTAKIWDITNGEELHTLKGHTAGISSVAISPNGKYVVTGSRDNTAKIWNLKIEELNNDLRSEPLNQVLLRYLECNS